MPRRIPTHRPRPAAHPAPPRDQVAAEQERRKFYNSTAWVRLRAAFLSAHPLCDRCHAAGRFSVATHAHHVLERLARPDLALDWGNLEPLCGPCHSSHHASERPRTALDRAARPESKPAPPSAAPALVVTLETLVDAPPAARLLPLTPARPGAIARLIAQAETRQVLLTSPRLAPAGPPDPAAILQALGWLVARGVQRHWITVDPDRSGRIVLVAPHRVGT